MAHLTGLAELASSLSGLASREHTMVSDSSELCLSTLLASEACDSDFSSSSALLSPCCPCMTSGCKHGACMQTCLQKGWAPTATSQPD